MSLIKHASAIMLLCMSVIAQATQADSQTVVPAGSPLSDQIQFQFALYYLPKPATDPVKVLKTILQKQPGFVLVDKLPDTPKTMVLQAHLEMDVPKNYRAPDMEYLQYFGRGLSREQAEALQKSKQALIVNFAYPRKYVWQGLHAASVLMEELARQTNGLLWDEMTRETFTPEAWHKIRLGDWQDGITDVSNHTTIHAYQSGELVRAISLGMDKFGLPDVVVEEFAWSSGRNVGNLLTLFTQAMAEGAVFKKAGEYDLDIKAIKHPTVRETHMKALLNNASAVAKLSLFQAGGEEGDPDNRIIELRFDRYPGNDMHAKRDAMLSSLFGSEDAIAYIKHDEALETASQQARAKLPALRADFKAGLQPGEFIMLKVPFATPDGGNEWMWIEVTKWQGERIEGMLKNEPYNIPTLHAGQIVTVNQQDVFDYIRRYPDDRQEGNETGRIIQQMQSRE